MDLNDPFLVELRDSFHFPEYLLILLKISRYCNQYSMKTIINRDITELFDIIQEIGSNITTADDYSAEIKKQFETACEDVFISLTRFKIPSGDLDLMRGALSKCCSGPAKKKKRTQNEEDDSESFFNDKWKKKLSMKIKNGWPPQMKALPPPATGEFSESEKLIWTVKCPKCSQDIKVHLYQYNANVSFNTGNFFRHLKIHFKQLENDEVINQKNSNDNSKTSVTESGFSDTENLFEIDNVSWSAPNLDINNNNESSDITAPIPKKVETLVTGNPKPIYITSTKGLVRIPLKNIKLSSNVFNTQPITKINMEQKSISVGVADTQESSLPDFIKSKLLEELLISHSQTKFGRNGNRYTDKLIKICMYFFLVSGNLAYETMYTNLMCIPCPRTIRNHMNIYKARYTDGHMYFSECKDFLVKRGLPLFVSVAEDATRILTKVEYDSTNNQLIGFVSPLNNDGIPRKLIFPAETPELIVKYFEYYKKANNVIVIMVQSLQLGSPSFVLGVIPSNNKFKIKDVKNRWKYMKSQFEDIGIEVVCISSDGDSRYFGAMKEMSNYGSIQKVYGLDCPINFSSNDVFIQDPAHKNNNMKNRFYDPAVDMRIGLHSITVNHLLMLIKSAPKNEHLLAESDLYNEDRMNYKVIYKIANETTLNLLEHHVRNCNGTIQFLTFLKNLLDAFMEENVTIADRIYKSMNTLLLLRIWRYYLIQNPQEGGLSSFVTNESYQAIELNVWSLLKLVKICRDKIGETFFHVDLMNSQICENFFRLLRSNTSTFSTIVNFTTLELLERTHRIQIQEELINDLKTDFSFRKILMTTKKKERKSNENLPSDVEILTIIEKAINDATATAKKLGILIEGHERTSIDFHQISNCKENELTNLENDVESRYDDFLLNIENEKEFKFQNLIFKNEISGDQYLDVIKDQIGIIKFKKSKLCWLLNNSSGRVSTDRLRRYIYASSAGNCSSVDSSIIEKKEIISKGDIVIFCEDTKFILCEVLNFQYLDKKTLKSKRYNRKLCTVHETDLGVFGNWYLIGTGNILIPMGFNNYISVKQYIAHVSKKVVDFDNLKLPKHIVSYKYL